MILDLQRGYVDVQWNGREFRMTGELDWGPGGSNPSFDLFRAGVRQVTGRPASDAEVASVIEVAVRLLGERGIKCVVHGMPSEE